MGVRRTLSAIAMAIASCQPSGSTVAPPSPEPAPSPIAAVDPSPPAPAPDDDATPASAASEPPQPPPLQTMQAVAHGFDPEAVLLQLPDDVRPVVLFEDERVQLRRSVAAAMIRGKESVLPVDALERIEDAAASGRLVLEGDLQCRVPLSRKEVQARYFAAQPRAWIGAQCWDDCMLQVDVTDPRDPERFETWAADRIARPHDPTSWTKARVRRYGSMIGLGGIGLGGMSHPPPIRFETIRSIGPWRRAPGHEQLDPLEGEAARCAHPDRRLDLRHELRVSVGADGAVTRCTAESRHPLARREDGECLCEVLQRKLSFAPGRPGRRLRATAIDDGDSHGHGIELRERQPGTQTWLDRLHEHPWLGTCLADQRPAAGTILTMVLRLRPDGTITDASVFGDITTPASMTTAACLVREVRTVELPCAPPGISELQFDLAVTL